MALCPAALIPFPRGSLSSDHEPEHCSVRIRQGFVSHVFTCTAMGGIAYAPIYDSMQITYGYELTGIHEGHFTGSMNGAPAPGSSLRIAESQGACFIRALTQGRTVGNFQREGTDRLFQKA